MGTRNLTCVFKDGEYRVAQYGQFDGYPSGQGSDILAFLLSADMDQFRERMDSVSFATDEEVEQAWVECGKGKDEEMVGMDIDDELERRYPQHSRNTAAKILSLIQESEGEFKVVSSIDFTKDSLFCEWCYVVDLDKNTFEVYDGFTKSQLDPKERFYTGEPADREYYPVRFRVSFNLDNLPTEREFIDVFRVDDGEEETLGSAYVNQMKDLVETTPNPKV